MISALLLSACINLLAYLLLIFIQQYLCFGHMKLNNRNLFLCIAVAYSSLSISQLFCSEMFSGFWLIFILFYTTVLFFSKRRILDILLSLLTFLLYLALRAIPCLMLKNIFPSLNGNFILCGLEIPILDTAIDITLLIALFVLRHFIQKYQYAFHATIKAVLFSILLPCFCFLLLALVMFMDDIPLAFQYFWNIFPLFAYLLGLIYYFYVLVDDQRRIYRENLARTQSAYLRTQLDILQDLKEKEEDIHKMRHDLKNHLTIIEGLCSQGQYEEVLSYSSQLNGMFSQRSLALSGNKIADIILHTKMNTAQQAGIDFCFDGTLMGLSTLSEPDICGLLANAYDNAIEACQAQENAYIHTKANTTKNHTYIEIRNSISSKKRIRNNQLKTTKDDKKNHGFGLEIMKQIAHKYHGSCEISSTDTEFIVEITLLTDGKAL